RHLSFVLVLFAAIPCKAIPRFSLLTGTRCSACHFDPQGSGLRTELGWEMMSQTGLFLWGGQDTSGIPATNMLYHGTIVPGGDARFQLVRLSTTGQEMLIPMQLSTSLGFIPTPQVTMFTNINWASIYVRNMPNFSSSLYPGETDYDVTLMYQPSITLPSIRIGMIEPSISIRQDDHTLFAHQEAAIQSIALIPPYYNEIGAELTYEGIRWLTVNAGIFNAKNLAEIDPTIGTIASNFDFKHPTISARVVLWPQLLEQGLNGELGGSILVNGSFEMLNGFAGIGLADKATLYFEGLYNKDAANRIVRNWSAIGSLELTSWLAAEWRYDWGMTEVYPGQALGYATAFLAGLEFFPFPYIELRPEYRVFDKNPFSGTGTHTGQWTGQVHVFY
ncbi:MAG TPA: hypothetical protein VFD13_03460, partial [Candidatus Kapabacteria bacterium]|nr:hypothetical protein [Candidatus Kapabacteria bacterium]